MAQKVQGGCDRKVPGGKLIRTRVELEIGEQVMLSSVKVYGDFFMHPESLIEDIETVLLESGLDLGRARAGLNSLFQRPDVNVFGAGPEDFLVTFSSALADARTKAGVP
jgi:hypothetical protein